MSSIAAQIAGADDAAATERQRRKRAVENMGQMVMPLDESSDMCVTMAERGFSKRPYDAPAPRPGGGLGAAAAAPDQDAEHDAGAAMMASQYAEGQYTSWLVVGVPASLCVGNGMLTFKRGDSDEGRAATYLQLIVEFMLATYAYPAQQIGATPNADVTPAQVIHVYLEAVVHETDNALPLQDPPRARTPVLKVEDVRDLYDQQKLANLFSNGNYAGWRMHFVLFDTRLQPSRMMRQRIIRNQHISGLVADDEVITARIVLAQTPLAATDAERQQRVGNALYQHRCERYLEKHPEDRSADSIPVQQPTTAQVRHAIHQAEMAPPTEQLNNAIAGTQRGTGDLYTAMLTNRQFVEMLHNYTRLCGTATADAPSVRDEKGIPWQRGGAAEALAPHRVFTLENSTRILQRYSPFGLISPQQAAPEYYGLGEAALTVRSCPFPHLMYQLPLGLLSPQTMMMYRAPWNNMSPFELACQACESAIALSNRIEQKNRMSGASAGGGGEVARAADGLDLVYGAHMTVRGQLSRHGGLTTNVRRDAITQRLAANQRAVVRAADEAALARDEQNNAHALSFVASVVAGKDALHDTSALRAQGIDAERFLRLTDERNDAPVTRRFVSGITTLSDKERVWGERMARIVSQWPPRHGPEACAEPAERIRRQRECASRLKTALRTTVEHEFEAMLLRGDSSLSSTYMFVSRYMRNGMMENFFVPSLVRMRDYTMDSIMNHVFVQDVIDCYGIRRELGMVRRLFLNAPNDNVRPGMLEGTPFIFIGPADISKSFAMNALVRQMPMDAAAPLMYGSAKHDLVGGATQANNPTFEEEMPDYIADSRPHVQAKNRERIDQEKKKSTQTMMRVSRLQKDEQSGDFRANIVEVERSGAVVRMGNYLYSGPGTDRAIHTRSFAGFLMPTKESPFTTAGRMLNIGRQDKSDAQTAYESRRVMLNSVGAIVSGASQVGLLPRPGLSLAAVIEYDAMTEMSQWAPEMQLDNRKQRRFHTYAWSNHKNAAMYQECSSMVSRYVEWDGTGPAATVVGAAPFRIDTLHSVWATHMFVKAPAAVTAICDTIEEYRPSRLWQMLYIAAARLCGFDRYVYEPIYRAHKLLPDVQARADEFVEGPDFVGRGRLPSFVREYDTWVDMLTTMARERNASTQGGGMSIVEGHGGRYPSFLRFSGTYDTLVFRLTSVLNEFFQIEAIQVRSMLDELRGKSIRMPVLAPLNPGTPATPDTLHFSQTTINTDGTDMDVDECIGGGGGGGGSSAARPSCSVIRWVQKPVISTVRTMESNGRRRLASGGDAEAASGTNDDNGNEVQIAIHYLMVELHHLYYMGATSWCDSRTGYAKLMLPIPSIVHEEVMHTMEIGPRYHAPEKRTYNPNYKGSGHHHMAMDVNTSALSEVLGGIDTRSTYERSMATIDPASNTPIISYRYSLEMDKWIEFLRDNHIEPTDRDREMIGVVEKRVERELAKTVAAASTALLASAYGLDAAAAAEWMCANGAAAQAAILAGAGCAKHAVGDVAAAVAEAVDAACETALEGSVLVQEFGVPPGVARAWRRMTTFDRWAILHQNAPLRPERRLQLLQQNNKFVNQAFNRSMATIDEVEYPEVTTNHVECDRALRVIVNDLVPLRDQRAKAAGHARGPGSVPAGLPAEREAKVRELCRRHDLMPAGLTHAEANDLLDFVQPEGRWGQLFASAVPEYAADKRRAEQMRSMIVDQVTAQTIAKRANLDDLDEKRRQCASMAKKVHAVFSSLQPPVENSEVYRAWAYAAVMMLLYYRARLQELTRMAIARASTLYNTAYTLGGTVLRTMVSPPADNIGDNVVAYVKARLTPVETLLLDKKHIAIDGALHISKRIAPAANGNGKRPAPGSLPAAKRIADDSESDGGSLFGSEPTEEELVAAAAAMSARGSRPATAAALSARGRRPAGAKARAAVGHMTDSGLGDDEDSLDAPGALDAQLPSRRAPTSFAQYGNLFTRGGGRK